MRASIKRVRPAELQAIVERQQRERKHLAGHTAGEPLKVIIPVVNRLQPRTPFALLFTANFLAVARDARLRAIHFLVLHALAHSMEFGNRITATPSQLATILGVRRETISRAIAQLRAHAIIVDHDGAPHFNPQLMFRGEAHALQRGVSATLYRESIRITTEIETVWEGVVPPFDF